MDADIALTQRGFRQTSEGWVRYGTDVPLRAKVGADLVLSTPVAWIGAEVSTAASQSTGDPAFDERLGFVPRKPPRFHGLHQTLRAALAELGALGVVHLGPQQLSVRVALPLRTLLRREVEAMERTARATRRRVSLSDMVQESPAHVAADALQWLLHSDPEAARAAVDRAPAQRGSRFWALERFRALQDEDGMVGLLRDSRDAHEAAHGLGAFAPEARLRLLARLMRGSVVVLDGASRWVTKEGVDHGTRAEALRVLLEGANDRRGMAALVGRTWGVVRDELGPGDAALVADVAGLSSGTMVRESVTWLQALPPTEAAAWLRHALERRGSRLGHRMIEEALESLRSPGALSVVGEGGGLSLAPDASSGVLSLATDPSSE